MRDAVTTPASSVCNAHTWDNAVQWSLGQKSTISHNPKALALMKATKQLTATCRDAKPAELRDLAGKEQYKRQIVAGDTRWSAMLLSAVQLLAMMNAIDRSTQASAKVKGEFTAAGGWPEWKALIPVLQIAYEATQTLQAEKTNLVDGVLM